MAWVEEVAGGVFRVRMRVADGRQVVVARCESRAEAEAVARVLPGVEVDAVARRVRREVAVSLAVWQGVPRPRPGSDPRLEAWVAAWRMGLVVRESTRAKYESHLRLHILPYFGRMRLSEISRVEVKAWARTLEAGMRGSSVCSITALLAGILAEAVREGLMAFNPALKLKVASNRPEPRPVADALEVRELASRMPQRFALMTITAAYTGMRWGELAGLHRANLVLEPANRHANGFVPFIRIDPLVGALHEVCGRLELGPPKTGAGERLVHLPPFLAMLLGEHLETHPGPHVFTGARGGWLWRGVFRKNIWLPALAGDEQHPDPARHTPIAEGMTFHGLRHTHKTWMAEHHTPESLQDYRMGHSPRGVQGRYEHHTPPMIDQLMRDLQQRWNTTTTTSPPPAEPPAHNATADPSPSTRETAGRPAACPQPSGCLARREHTLRPHAPRAGKRAGQGHVSGPGTCRTPAC